MKKFLDSCPGLVGDIARYINDTLETEQPAIALAAAFGFMGSLLSQRVCCKQSGKVTEPCLFTVVIADSGSGKTQAQNIIAEIITAAKMDVSPSGFLLGPPASDSGLLKALSTQGRRFFMWDEMGLSLSAYSKSKSSCEAAILATTMRLFSMAGKLCVGKQYSTQDRVDVQDPYLSIFGASTHNRFFGALNTDFVEDGFIPRWLLFFESDKRVEKQCTTNEEMFNSIVDRVAKIERWEPISAKGNLAEAAPETQPRRKVVVDLLPEVIGDDVFDALEYWKINISNALDSSPNGSVRKILHTRAYEQTLKLCLCLSEQTGGKVVCSKDSINFAIELMRAIIKLSCEKCDKHIYTNERARERGRLREKILAILKQHKQISKNELCSLCDHMGDSRERGEIISSLIDAGTIREDKMSVDGSFRKSLFYTYTARREKSLTN